MASNEKSVLDDLATLGAAQRKSFWTQLPGSVESDELQDLFKGLTEKAPPPALRGFLVDTVKALPPQEQAAAATEALKSLPEDQQKAVQSAVFGPALGLPGSQVRDKLWLIVVVGFAIVLVGSFLALAVGVFVPAGGKVEPELIIAMFTSVVGFLAGLFVPSPGGQGGQGENNGAGVG